MKKKRLSKTAILCMLTLVLTLSLSNSVFADSKNSDIKPLAYGYSNKIVGGECYLDKVSGSYIRANIFTASPIVGTEYTINPYVSQDGATFTLIVLFRLANGTSVSATELSWGSSHTSYETGNGVCEVAYRNSGL